MRLLHLLLTLLLFVCVSATIVNEPTPHAAAIIFACSRPSHLRRTLRSLAAQEKSLLSQINIFVSIDAHRRADHVQAAAQVESESLGLSLHAIWRHTSTPIWEALTPRDKITAHYHRSLSRLFSANSSITHAIVLEDDLDLAPDFLAFLLSFAPYTSTNATKGPAAISGWNDNAAAHLSPLLEDVHLTEFFPGLGWLLPRQVWLQLENSWPNADIAPSCSNESRLFPAARVAPTGWDWWMRSEFTARKWTTLYPSRTRVAHRGGMTGTNVDAKQQRMLYARASLSGINNALNASTWANIAHNATARHPIDFANRLSTIEQNARTINIDALHAAASDPSAHDALSISFEEREYPALARTLRLWPTPRGFWNGRLEVRLQAGAPLLLVRAAVRRARQRELRVAILAARNVSCTRACAPKACVDDHTASWNDCAAMALRFGCEMGCIFETGADLPAIVEKDAPLATAGACVVGEHGANVGGAGRYEHTRRVCVCEGAGLDSVDVREKAVPLAVDTIVDSAVKTEL